MNIKSFSLFLLIGLGLLSCSDDFENDVNKQKPTAGQADFSHYVAIGNSLTSGFSNGALYKSAQQQSFPSMIAAKMNQAGGSTFKQPLMPDDIGGFSNLGLNGKLTLKLVNGNLAPVALPAEKTLAETLVTGSFNNMGVPGAKSFHLLAPGYGNSANLPIGKANPYFVRFASSPNTTVIGDVLAQKPTFFTLWIGNNDVLSYATSGGDGTNQKGNVNPATYGPDDISDPNVVVGSIQQMLELLVTQNKAKGAIANIPDVTSIPFFTTVPAKPLDPRNKSYADKIAQLNGFYNQYLNPVLDAIGASDRKISFSATEASGIVFVDDSLPDLTANLYQAMVQAGVPSAYAGLIASTFGQARQSNANDMIPLTTAGEIGSIDESRVAQLMSLGVPQEQAGILSIVGMTYPEDDTVLSNNEIAELLEATTQINEGIKILAQKYQLAFVNANEFMKNFAQNDLVYNGVTYSAEFVSGGGFSLDGVHMTPRGYGIIANLFIQQINKTYGSTLNEVDINNYSGILLP